MKFKKLIYLQLILLFVSNILFADDFFSAIDGIAEKLSHRIDEKIVAIGIISTNDKAINNDLGNLIRDQLSMYLANYGVDIVSIDLSENNLKEELIKNPKNQLLIDNIKEHTNFDIWITGSLSKWGQKNYSLQVSMFDSKNFKVLGGASSIIDNNSLPADMVRDSYDLDNTPETRAVSYVRAEYESNALGVGYGIVPTIVSFPFIQYENKISDYFSIIGYYSQFTVKEKEERDYYGNYGGYKESENKLKFAILGTRYYPFYEGKGLRGFFIGASMGVVMEDYHKDDYYYDRNGESYLEDTTNSDDSYWLVRFEIGRKFVIAERIFIEPGISILKTNNAALIWGGVALGIVF